MKQNRFMYCYSHNLQLVAYSSHMNDTLLECYNVIHNQTNTNDTTTQTTSCIARDIQDIQVTGR